ncbi:MAG: NusG domain II-containing protein [Thermodesulfovibrionia bacterium]|nr:NusG domain II-containing protein [Thermodesulfovibrionia bacterium]
MKKLFKDLKPSSILGMATLLDKLLFLCLTIFAVISFFLVREILPSGTLVSINLNNTPVYKLPLDKDRVVKVTGPLGESFVEIKNGMARMMSAPCPQQICVHQGWINRGAIACLPNKIIVAFGGYKQYAQESGYDAVTK